VGKAKQRMCRICKKRPPWKYKNCPPGVCKRCYHKDVWVGRPAARKGRDAAAQKVLDDPGFEVELFEDGWDDALDPPWPEDQDKRPAVRSDATISGMLCPSSSDYPGEQAGLDVA
jgi:hypothetical protein